MNARDAAMAGTSSTPVAAGGGADAMNAFGIVMGTARGEWTLLRRERRLWIALCAVAVLLLVALFATAAEQRRQFDEKRAVAAAERARWLAQDAKDPHSAAHYSIYAFKPPSPLAMLDPGIEPFVGQALWLEAHHRNDMLYRPQADASRLQRAGLANPTSILTALMPLLAFLLAFAAVAGERERGTWRLALGAARYPATLVLAKALAICGLLVATLVLPLVAATLAIAASRGLLDADVLLRLGAWSTAMTLYAGIFTAIGLCLSLASRNVRMALGTLFAVWMLLALVAPRWAGEIASRAVPLPSTQSVRHEIQSEAPAYWLDDVAQARRGELLKRYGVSREEDLPVDLRGAELDAAERHSHAVFDRVLGGFHDRVVAQDRRYAALGALSPSVAMVSVSQAAAATDFVHHRDFIDAAEHYRRALVNRMNAEVMRLRPEAADERHLVGAELWAQIPDFSYRIQTYPQIAAYASPAWLALAVWSLLALVALLWMARRARP